MDINTNAAALIVAAAEKSGLLKEVAEALCFIARHGGDRSQVDAVLNDLADAFDDHICGPAITLENLYGEGVEVGPFAENELAPFLQIPMLRKEA